MNENNTERTRDIYEIIGGYPKPPLIPIEDLYNDQSFVNHDFKPGSFALTMTRAILKMVGFHALYETLPQNLESMLRTRHTRLPGLYAPVIAATLALKDDPSKSGPLERAASIIIAAYRFHEELLKAEVEPDRYEGQVLEMGLYPNLFSTSLQITESDVRLHKSRKKDTIIVLANRQFFEVTVYRDGKQLSFAEICHLLGMVAEAACQNPRQSGNHSPGMVTAASDRTQIKAFRHMLKTSANKEILARLDTAFLTVCLDLDSFPASYETAAYLAHSTNQGNRWYHSATQFIIFGNAKACVINNFTAYIDGATMVRASMEIYRRAAQVATVKDQANDALPAGTHGMRLLDWHFPQRFFQAVLNDIRLVTDNQQATFRLKGLGRRAFGTYASDTIPVFVAALQITAAHFIGGVVYINQFVTMSRYRCMGLEISSVTTREMIRLVEIFEDAGTSAEAMFAYLREAVESQRQIIRQKRSHMTLDSLFSYFMVEGGMLRKGFLYTLMLLSAPFRGRIRLFKQKPNDIIISHPPVYEEVPVLGRPGVRIPYARYFGLHYQVFEDDIIVTMMPTRNWDIPNAEFVATLERTLERLQAVYP